MGPQKRRTAVAALEYGPEFIGPEFIGPEARPARKAGKNGEMKSRRLHGR